LFQFHASPKSLKKTPPTSETFLRACVHFGVESARRLRLRHSFAVFAGHDPSFSALEDQPVSNIRVLIFLSVAITLAAVATASLAGAPLKGVDVKLGKNPGGMLAARTTDKAGGFSFGVWPKGNYRIVLDVQSAADARSGVVAELILQGGTGHRIDQRVGTSEGAVKNSGHANEIDFVSDGIHPITGVVTSPAATR
jgi:hypothetical protein